MDYSAKTLAEAFVRSAEDASGDEFDTLSKNFYALLKKKRLIKKIPHILNHLGVMQDKKDRRLRARITSAETLSKKNEEEIKKTLSKKYEVDHVILETSIDESLISGLTLRIGWESIDNTLKGRLQKLRELMV